MIQLCRHILPGGKLCDQAAVKDTLFCRHHSTVKTTLAKEKAAPDPELMHTPIAFVYPEDKAAVQLNYFLVLEALNHKRIDSRTANAMNRLLHSCELNMRKGALAEANREKVAKNVVTLPDGEEVGMPRQAMEVSDEPVKHTEECLCAMCEEEFRGAEKERHHAECKCGACFANGGEEVRDAAAVLLYEHDPEPAPEPEEGGSGYQELLLQQQHDRKAREQQEREKAAMEALAAEYELRVDGEVKWKKGMKEALLEHFKQAMAEGRPYEPREMAATGA
ncbi:MAG TPA: hypothetical protein VME86_12695 [Acidobacteriaceae bacterium]|nr:hypothetical protein [Acidobacteriaceae bacterium]